jgi:hypothetical protein
MKTTGFPVPTNSVQTEFKRLCELGGGASGGPARGRVQELLRSAGRRLNILGENEIAQALEDNPNANPLHVCFAVGLVWGHLARFESDFIAAAVAALEHWHAADVRYATRFHNERGPEPIRQSLAGGRALFEKVVLPAAIPNTLKSLGRAQERWFSPILSKDRPPYIGAWNATAMFMTALFARPDLAAQLTDDPTVLLPPNGPVFAALKLLHQAHFLASGPVGTELDDQGFEPGAIYENNATFTYIRRGLDDWNLVDVHSGLYMLGTRATNSENYINHAKRAVA